MYYGKKKIIIIAIVIVVLIIALAVGGLFLYMTTDLFKSNQTLFLKYAANQYGQLSSKSTNVQMQDILNAEEQLPYETTATLTFNYEDENGEIFEELEKTKVNILTKQDKINQKQYANLKIDYDNNNLMDLHYAKSNNIYALKWEEIVLNYFVGIENSNLKEFAEKLGIQDTENIPDEIKAIDYLEILELTEQEKQHITQTYMNVFISNIAPEKYNKQKDMAITKNGINYNATAYRLDLSAEEIKNIEIKLLETLQQDSITLNLITTKAKLMGLSEEYTIINNITAEIQEMINELNMQQVDNSKGLSIVIYESDGKAIQTEIILKNEMKLTITSDTNNNMKSTNIQLYNLSEEQEYNTINVNMTETITNSSTTINLNINVDNKQNISMVMSNVGLASAGNVQTTVSLSALNEIGENITVDYEAQTTYGNLTEDIVNLDNTNCVVLNNYPSQSLTNLLTSIVQRVSYVFEQKMQIIGLGETEDITPDNTVTEQNNNI